MIQITNQFKSKIITALLDVRNKYDGSDAAFAKQWSINASVYSRLKKGETEALIKDNQWIDLARQLVRR